MKRIIRKISYLFMNNLKKIVCIVKWRKSNSHNMTTIAKPYCDAHMFVKVGKKTYGEIHVYNTVKNRKMFIGSYCSIADDVIFMLGNEHSLNNLSTYPFKVKILKNEISEAESKGDIVIEDDVWIGYGATIMSGVKISQGAVVAARALVTADVPPYAIVAGVPAKVLKYRYSKDIIAEMRKIDFDALTVDMIRNNETKLYEKIIDPTQLDWMPKHK